VLRISIWSIEVLSGGLSGDGTECWAPCDSVGPSNWGVWSAADTGLTEWLCADVAGYNIINVYKPPLPWLTPTTTPTLPVCMLATSTANMSTGATAQHLLTVRVRPPGQQPITSGCCKTQRE